MPYSHLLVAVAPTPESRMLVNKAVSIARPSNAQVSLITLATDPEMYNQFAAPMMENLREIMQEETRSFLNELAAGRTTYQQNDHRQWRTLPPREGFCLQHHVDWSSAATITRACFPALPVQRRISSAAAESMCCWFPRNKLMPKHQPF